MEDKKKLDMKTQPQIKISNATKDRVATCKAYIERKYAKQLQEDMERKVIWDQLFQNMSEMNFSTMEQNMIKKEIQMKESEQLRKISRAKISVDDFEPISIIGRGAFGEVRVCRDKQTHEIVAIKKMKKSEMISKNQLNHIRAERDILASADIPWIVELKYSFQDDKNLYLVMEFLVGGDLMSLLIRQDIISEAKSKFYIAEIVLSIEAIHKMQYIHRDLKPDNILIDNQGHIKLSDFGLCKQFNPMSKLKQEDILFMQQDKPILTNRDDQESDDKPKPFKRNRQLAYSTVGTPDYIAPEVFERQGYTETVDWWSLGVILYEMVVGHTPFYSDSPEKTCKKIMQWKKHLTISQDAKLSSACLDLICRLISDKSVRIGLNGASEIKAHPFFKGVDWTNIRQQKPPYIPDQSSLTKNFDKFEEGDPWLNEDHKITKRGRQGDNFQGYTYKRNIERERSPLIAALEELETIRPTTIKANFDKKQKSQSPPAKVAQLQTNLNFVAAQFQKFQRSQSPRVNNNDLINSKLLAFAPLKLGRDNLSPLNKSNNDSFAINYFKKPNDASQSPRAIFSKLPQSTKLQTK